MKTILTAVALATLVAAPAFAGTYTASNHVRANQTVKTMNGSNSFAMAPRQLSAFSPALNGGGSTGYNQQQHQLDAAY